MPQSVNVQALRDIGRENPKFAAMFNHLMMRRRDRDQTDLRQYFDRASTGWRDKDGTQYAAIPGLSPQDVLSFYSMLQNYGLGTVIQGRHGKPARFKWGYSVRSLIKHMQEPQAYPHIHPMSPSRPRIRRVARQEAPVMQEAPQTLQPRGVIKGVFYLRPDFKLYLTLPADFSRDDAAKLKEFVDSLPIIEESRASGTR